jgi:hypothetical protein
MNVKIGTEDMQPNGSLDSELRSSAQESTFLDKCVALGAVCREMLSSTSPKAPWRLFLQIRTAEFRP